MSNQQAVKPAHLAHEAMLLAAQTIGMRKSGRDEYHAASNERRIAELADEVICIRARESILRIGREIEAAQIHKYGV
jgi:hypothetical protein